MNATYLTIIGTILLVASLINDPSLATPIFFTPGIILFSMGAAIFVEEVNKK